MKLKSLALAAALVAAGIEHRAHHRACVRAGQGAILPGAGVPHRRLRAQRRAVRQRLRRLPQARQRQGRHQRRQDHLGGVRDRLRHRQGRRVLRAPEGQEGATVFQPLSTGITFALTEKAPGDKIPLITAGLRPQREHRRHGVQVELPAHRHLLGRRRRAGAAHRQEGRRVRQAQGQEDRAGLSRQPLRQGADPAAAGARQAWTASSCSCCRWRTPASSRRPPGCRSARTSPTTSSCGAGA